MSVIIRLQNLPWAANARDIRNFFAGLSIPEGGVHIIGGEMGDAFIAFSTDEDARKAMLKDREKLMETQVRLLLSSRAEMQKVIETARQQSLAAAAVNVPVVAPTATPIAAVAKLETQMPLAPTPPIISASGLQNFLTQASMSKAPSFLAYQQQAGIVLADAAGIGYGQKATAANSTKKEQVTPERRRSSSRDRRRSSSRDRRRSSSHERHRSRSRSRERYERDHNSSRRSRYDRHSRDRSRSWSRERDWRGSRSSRRDEDSRERELGSRSTADAKSKKPMISPWSIPPVNAGSQQQQLPVNPLANEPFKISATSNLAPTPFNIVSNLSQSLGGLLSAKQDAPLQTPLGTTPVMPAFQNYSTSSSTTNNYSINLLSGLANNESPALNKPLSLQNPYLPALQSINSSSSSSDSIPGLGLGLPNQQQQMQQQSSMLSNSGLNLFSKLSPENKSDAISPSALLVKQQAAALLKQQAQQQSTMSIVSQQLQQGKAKSQLSDHPIATQSTLTPQIKTQPVAAQQPLPQEPIAFASVNPYAQMYPQLFEQAAARTTGPPPSQQHQQQQQQQRSNQNNQSASSPSQTANTDTCYIKISNMCNSTTYSDLRKFFSGLYIPHNGIKIINDSQGQRVGIAFVEFSRVSSAHKALARTNTQFKNKLICIEAISHHEFENAEDSYRPGRQHEMESNATGSQNNRQSPTSMGSGGAGDDKREPYTVLFLEELPQLTTEQDIMKMFSSFTIVDILMCASPNNRREQVAHVQFSRENEARAALDDTGRHTIGYRKIRVRPGRLMEMKNAKEKLRLANEQLMKEEQASSAILVDDDSMDVRDIDMDEGGSESNGIESEGSSRFTQENSNNAFDASKMNGGNFIVDPRRRGQSQQQSNMPRNHHNNNNNSNNNYNNNMDEPHPFMINTNNNQGGPQPNFQVDEEKYVLAKNCEYGTRINDMGEWLSASDLRMNHIEMLYNERNLPAGEFIIEFIDSRDADRAVREFHNRRFRGRSIRFMHITPQDIANRLGKPFMNYVPGGNGKVVRNNVANENDGREQLVQAALELINRSIGMGNSINENLLNPMCFAPNENSIDQNQHNNRPMPNENIDDNMKQHRNPFADPPIAGINDAIMGCNEMPMNLNLDTNSNSVGNVGDNDDSGGIPDKFNRPGCVVAMRNVPFKANLKDILRFFNDYKLNPEDIIRRFNDDGTPTGDARVAFESSEQARAAFESRRRKQIFHRNIFLSIL